MFNLPDGMRSQSVAFHSAFVRAKISDLWQDSHFLPSMAHATIVLAILLAPLVLALTPSMPSVGRIKTPSADVFVFGSVHTPSAKQLHEVSSLISEVQPDVVLLELDQQRLEVLLSQPDTAYGAELAVAARSANEAGAVVLLGDAKERDSVASVLAMDASIADGERVARAVRFALDPPRLSSVARIDVPAALLADPFKALPIVVAALVTLTACVIREVAVGTGAGAQQDGPLAIALLGLQCVAALRLVDVFLLRRDDFLAESVMRAVRIGSGLRSGKLVRRQWQFAIDRE